MSREREDWGRFAAKAAVLAVVVMAAAFVGNKLANAGPGEPVRKALTVSGVVTGVSGSTMTTFRFYRAMGDTTPLCAPEVPITPDANGAFSVEVPLDQSGAGRTCPETLFHDPSAYVEVAIGAAVVVTRRAINPVPYAVYAQQYGTPDCPVGYEKTDESPAGKAFCRRPIRGRRRASDMSLATEEVVRVGQGATAFWIDRWESSVWVQGPGSIELQPVADARMVTGFAINGSWASDIATTPFVIAYSVVDVQPTNSITWFQASEACRASGKRLPTTEEWIVAAQGTRDPGSHTGEGFQCLTDGRAAGVPRRTGFGRENCRSVWGAQDMIGNVMEWGLDWEASAGTNTPATDNHTWTPTEFSGDLVGNVTSGVEETPGRHKIGVPGAAILGGSFAMTTEAGRYSILYNNAPSTSGVSVGFRCVIPR